MQTVKVFAWERDPSVTFNAIHQNIVVDPRSYAENQAGAEAAAAAFISDAQDMIAAGHLVSFRYWFEHYIGSLPRLYEDWWNTYTAYEEQPNDSLLIDWWGWFSDAVIASGVSIYAHIHDFEKNMGYYSLPDQTTRQTIFEPVTIAGSANPYPNDPNPYIGDSIWSYSDPSTDAFIKEYNLYANLERRDRLREMTGAMGDLAELYSNYNHFYTGFQVGDLLDRPGREVDANTDNGVLGGGVSSPNIYWDYRTTESATDPEPEYTTARELVNRRRWKNFIANINRVRSIASYGSGRPAPWIAPPGYGASGADSWASSSQLAFEYLMWRQFQAHLEEMGIYEFIMWNPVSNNPNSAATDAWMDEYFSGRRVPQTLNRSLPLISMDADEVVTGGVVTRYADLFEPEQLFYRHVNREVPIMLHGRGTRNDPILVSKGPAGISQLNTIATAMNAVVERVPNFRKRSGGGGRGPRQARRAFGGR